MSDGFYNIDDLMDKLKEIEKKIDILVKEKTQEEDLKNATEQFKFIDKTRYDYHHAMQLGARKANVFLRSDGVWGIEKFFGGEFVEKEYFPGHSESYAEDAAENYVQGIKN